MLIRKTTPFFKIISIIILMISCNNHSNLEQSKKINQSNIEKDIELSIAAQHFKTSRTHVNDSALISEVKFKKELLNYLLLKAGLQSNGNFSMTLNDLDLTNKYFKIAVSLGKQIENGLFSDSLLIKKYSGNTIIKVNEDDDNIAVVSKDSIEKKMYFNAFYDKKAILIDVFIYDRNPTLDTLFRKFKI